MKYFVKDKAMYCLMFRLLSYDKIFFFFFFYLSVMSICSCGKCAPQGFLTSNTADHLICSFSFSQLTLSFHKVHSLEAHTVSINGICGVKCTLNQCSLCCRWSHGINTMGVKNVHCGSLTIHHPCEIITPKSTADKNIFYFSYNKEH